MVSFTVVKLFQKKVLVLQQIGKTVENVDHICVYLLWLQFINLFRDFDLFMLILHLIFISQLLFGGPYLLRNPFIFYIVGGLI